MSQNNAKQTIRFTKVHITPVTIDGVLDAHASSAAMPNLERLQNLINNSITSILSNDKYKNCTIDNVSVKDYNGSYDSNSGKYAVITYSYDSLL